MKKSKYVLISLVVAIGLKACLTANTKPRQLKGTFINQSYLNHSSDTLLHTIPFYCTELVFDHADSVIVRNGVEEYALPYIISHDTCYIKKAYQHQGVLQDLVLLIATDTSFVALEQDFTGNQQPALFTKTSIFRGFEYELNKATIAGNYTMPGSKGQSLITFAENGRIEGLSSFQKFSLCYAGDCMSEPLEANNVILLETASNLPEYAVWQFDKGTRMLSIFKLEAAKADIKGERAIKEKLFELQKVL